MVCLQETKLASVDVWYTEILTCKWIGQMLKGLLVVC